MHPRKVTKTTDIKKIQWHLQNEEESSNLLHPNTYLRDAQEIVRHLNVISKQDLLRARRVLDCILEMDDFVKEDNNKKYSSEEHFLNKQIVENINRFVVHHTRFKNGGTRSLPSQQAVDSILTAVTFNERDTKNISSHKIAQAIGTTHYSVESGKEYASYLIENDDTLEEKKEIHERIMFR